MKMIKEHKFITACIVAAVLIVVIVLACTLHRDEADMQEQAQSLQEAIEQRALQCYVIENAYPESLSYLEENYGLTVNKKDFQVIYTPFAENIPPDIRVIAKEAGR